jgi:hypothetical protein
MEHHAPREWQVATHCVRFEPPNLVVLVWKGAVTEEDADGVLAHLDAIEAPRYMVLTDVSQSDIPDSRARAKFARMRVRADAIAALVPSLHKRVVAEMIVRATTLLTGQRLNVAFFDNEVACRRWLAEENERIAKTAA